MSLTALPVTASDLTTLQSGIQFFTNSNQAASEVTSINAPGTTTDSVFIYASKLLNNNLSLSQVAMAVTALMEGGTIAVGNTTTPNTLTFLSTQFLPAQVQVALTNAFNPTVFAAEALGSALSTQPTFNTAFVGLNVSQFSQDVASLTGVNVLAIQQFVTNWQNFFNGVGASALQGRTVTQASYGAAFGDAVGVALLNPTLANLQTVVSTTPGVNAFSPNTIAGLVANALIDNAEGLYETGKALGALKAHTALQGEAATQPQTTFTFTPGTDTFIGTSGDDTYNGNITGVGAAPATLSPLQFDSAKDIGGGNDRINLNVLGDTSLAAVASLVTGVENWSFNTSNGALNAPLKELDASSLDSAKFIEQIGGLSKTNWVDVTKVGTGQTIAFTNQDLAGIADITVKDGVTAATVLLTNVDSGSVVRFNENTAGDLTTLTVNGSVADPGVLGIDHNSATPAVTTLNLGITSKATVNLFGAFQTLQTVDGNKSTGDLTLSVDGLPNVSSVMMGSGNDKLFDALSPKAATVTTVTENLGAGNDTLTMSDLTPAIGPHNVAFNVKLGDGGDTVAILGNLANIALAPTAANFQQGFFTITDFIPAQDTVNVAGAGAFITLTAAQQTAISGSANLFAAVQAAFTAAGALGVFDFSFGGNTYIADDNGGVGTFDAGDGIIQLTGVALAQLNNTNFIHA